MTNEELDEATLKEAKRRIFKNHPRAEVGMGNLIWGDVARLAARLAREGWTPPEPVDPDVLAFREWATTLWPAYTCTQAAYLAGARMAREQERERADNPIRMAEALADRCRRLLHSLPAGVHDQLDVKWGIDAVSRAIEAEIAKYRGEA